MISNENTTNFENNKFDLFENNKILLENIDNEDFDIFSDCLRKLNTTYFLPEEATKYFKDHASCSFSVLSINIRSINKNFEHFKLLLSSLKFCFKVICITETWTKDQDLTNNSL